jgi:hypothetical protein
VRSLVRRRNMKKNCFSIVSLKRKLRRFGHEISQNSKIESY